MAEPHRVLIAGDAHLRENLAEHFACVGDFTLIEARNLTEAIDLALTKSAEILLIDESLAEVDRLDPIPALARLRKSGFAGPVLLLSKARRELPAHLGESFLRPFRFLDLVSRLRALLRRGDNEMLTVGPYVFHLGSGDLVRPDGDCVRLTERESAILARLARAGGSSVARDSLLRDVWGYRKEVATRTLETHIYRLRRKIEVDPLRPSILLTDAEGYRLRV